MRLNINEVAAMVYGEIFDWPLTESEAKMWAISEAFLRIKMPGRDKRLFEWQQDKKLLARRQKREVEAGDKTKIAVTAIKLLAKIPTIQAVFLTGSVAVGNAKKASDVDFLVVTSSGTMWLTRAVVVPLLKWQGWYKKTICPNIFLDSDHLEIKEKNLYTAHEVLQAKCLFDRGGVAREWLRANKWTKDYLPKAYETFMAAV